MNIFIFNKSLRCTDNTTLIEQIKNESNVIPIFIFTEQVNQKKNKYFSHNSVQFMVESIEDLAKEIKNKYKGKLYLFHSDDFLDVLTAFNSIENVNSIGTNYDYSPYAKRRQDRLKSFCTKHKIKLYMEEDHVMYNVLDKITLKKDNTPYTVFTPFKNYCLRNLSVKKPNSFTKFVFKTNKILSESKYYIPRKELSKFYNHNPDLNVNGGRSNGLAILNRKHDFDNYKNNRDFLTYDTTFLAAHNHYGTVSIREVYNAFKNNEAIVNELHWRDYYYSLYHHFPHMLEGQIGLINKPFKDKFDSIQWNNDSSLFKAWCNGMLGIPICDAGMRQLNKTGFMHNRVRMITASVLTKLLLIDWRWGEKYFAQHLLDYDCIQNNGGWGWTCTGIDPKQVYRIFSPKLQGLKFDVDGEYIKRYVPELETVPAKSIHNWEIEYTKFEVNYPAPLIDYTTARKKGIKAFKV